MDTDKTQLQYNEGRFARYDSDTMPFSKDNHSSHFALTDAFITHAGETGQPMIHFWQTSPLVILGMMDTKLGHFDKAYPLFKQYNHDTIVRNSGGLGVISDPGVLNVSLIYPSKERRLSIDELMTSCCNLSAIHSIPISQKKRFWPMKLKTLIALEIMT